MKTYFVDGHGDAFEREDHNTTTPHFLFLILITLFGGFLRFRNLGANPLWVDETLFAGFVRDGALQEFIPIWIAQLFGLSSEFGLRSISAFAGTLSIPGIYWVLKNNRLAAAGIMAVFPVFVFWSRLARPYALAGLFVILAWRWAIFYLPAFATTPIAIFGLKFGMPRRIYPLLISIALFFFLIRPDAGRQWINDQLPHAIRWFYIPMVSLVLHCADKLIPHFRRLENSK